MNQDKYEANKKILKSNEELYSGMVKRCVDGGDGVGAVIFKTIQLSYELGIQATKENTEYDCRNSMLSKMTDSMGKV